MAEFESALAGLRQVLIDTNGDGIPDTAVPAGNPMPPSTMFGFDPTESQSGQPGPDWQSGQRFGQMIGEATGLPSVYRGGQNMYRGVASGDPSRFAYGAGEAALGALPAASVMRPTAPLVNSMFASAPRAVGAMTVPSAAMLPYGVQTAQASAQSKASEYANNDPEVQRLRSELAAVQRERLDASGKAIKGLSRSSADAARARADAAFGERENAITSQLEAAQSAALGSYMSNAPFRERNPGAAEAIMMGAGAAAAGLPFVRGIKNNLAESMVQAPSINRQLGRVEKSLGTAPEPTTWQRMTGQQPATPRANEQMFNREQDVLKRKLNRYDGGESTAGKYATNALMGTGMMMEGRMLPEEIDAVVYPYGHPTRDAALSALSNPEYYASGLVPSVLGGAMAGSVGTKLADIMTKTRPDLSRARSAAEWTFPSRGPAPTSPPQPAPTSPPQPANALYSAPHNTQSGSPGGAPVPPGGGSGGGSSWPPPVHPPQPGNVGTNGPRPSRPGGPSSSYAAPQRSVAQPYVDSEVMAGRIPTGAGVGNALSSAGLKVPAGPKYQGRVDNTAAIVTAMQDAGMSLSAIVAALKSLRDKGSPVLGIPAAAGLGVNALYSDSDVHGGY